MGPTPGRKATNGRSPLVNPQRQITSFFTKRPSTSPSPSPTTLAKSPNPTPTPNPKKQQRNPSPTTPSPVPPNPKKPLLVVGETTPCGAAYGDDVVGKRVRVYWPMDDAWYEGRVRLYDSAKGRHCVEYDDGEEEELELGKEKVEWVEEAPRRFKRLRKGSLGFSKMVVEDEEVKDVVEEGCSVSGDDSSDESWGGNGVKVVSDDDDDEELDDVELEDEEEEEEEGENKRGKRGGKCAARKRKVSSGGKQLGSGKKKSKCGENGSKDGVKIPSVEPLKNKQSQ